MPVDSPLYPVGLVVAERRCLVVGGGPVALRKAEGLLACGALVTVVAPDVVDGFLGLGVRVERRPYRNGEAADYRLVITAADDAEVNARVFADAEAAGVWVNSADDPERCSFTLPAVVRREPIVVAIATGGHSPALAARLRTRLAELIGPEHATLARLLTDARARLRAAGVGTETLDWSPLVDDAVLARLAEGDEDGVRALVDTWTDAILTGTSPPRR